MGKQNKHGKKERSKKRKVLAELNPAPPACLVLAYKVITLCD